MPIDSEVSKRRIGIMGGTFDPVHFGHTLLAEAALNEAGLDEVIFMPAYIQPFKRDRYIADSRDRLRMLELATSYEERFTVSSWELEQENVSYTYDTIESFIQNNPDQKIFFIMGSDAMMKIERWKRGKELLGICNLVVGKREAGDRVQLEEHAKRLRGAFGTEIIILEKQMRPISSTMVRERITAGKPITDMVSPLVEDYIYEHELYIKSKETEKRIEECFFGMTEKRRLHTENVVKVAAELARLYGADENKAKLAAKCHDFFRGKDIEEINSLVRHYGLSEKYIDNPNLAHGKLAAEFLENDLGTDDNEIIDAVSFHTTGRRDMSLIEKIVFIADAIEAKRDYPGVEEIRVMAYKDIDKACKMSLERTIAHLRETGITEEMIDRDTIDAYEYFKEQEKEK
ncbi:MAG: nicotinate-nucleotide adenylyltransferase [Firmicutes bacterium]|nr:nicotinate-nucleotide adenylyltransferase [Bacillota bacterium]